MRKPSYNEVARRIADSKTGIARRERMRAEYLDKKEERESAPEVQYYNKVRLIVQAATRREEEAYNLLANSMQLLMDDIFELIKTTLKEYDEDIMQVPDEIIEKVLGDCSLAIRRLEKDCADPKYLARLNPTHPTAYEKLFIQLIEKVDVRFALYAPQRSLAKVTYKFERLSKENKEKLFERLVKFGFFKEEAYLERYSYAFKDQLEANPEYQV